MQTDGVAVGPARRWAWLAVLIGGALLFEIVRRVLAEVSQPGNVVPTR